MDQRSDSRTDFYKKLLMNDASCPLQEEALNPVQAEMAVWRAVILQALEDAGSQSRKVRDQYNRTKAIHWLTSFSPDFIMVCDYAGLDPAWVRMRAKRALLNGCRWRNEPKKLAKDKDISVNTQDICTDSAPVCISLFAKS